MPLDGEQPVYVFVRHTVVSRLGAIIATCKASSSSYTLQSNAERSASVARRSTYLWFVGVARLPFVACGIANPRPRYPAVGGSGSWYEYSEMRAQIIPRSSPRSPSTFDAIYSVYVLYMIIDAYLDEFAGL